MAVREKSQQLHAVADGYELAVVVARGAVELREAAARISATAMIRLGTGESEALRALEANTLLSASERRPPNNGRKQTAQSGLPKVRYTFYRLRHITEVRRHKIFAPDRR